jgi:hypothetical protein
MATIYDAILDKAFMNGPRLNLTITGTGKDTKISGTIEKTDFTSTDENGETIEYLKIPLIKPVKVGMSSDPVAGKFDVDHVFVRETFLRTLTIEDNLRQDPDGGVYFVRNKKIGETEVEMEFVADISSTHTIQYGEPFCLYQEVKISTWLKEQRKNSSEQKKTRRQELMEAITAKRNKS